MKMRIEEYESMYVAEEKLWWYQSLHEVVLTILKNTIKKKKHILDAGCGTGKMMEKLIASGFRTDGFDLSEKAVSFCKKRGIDSVKKGSILSIPYTDDRYDAVIVLDVIGLIKTAEVHQAVKELYRVLKKGGYCIVHAAALEFLRSDHDEVCNLQHRYRISELQKLFPAQDWKKTYSSYRLFLLFPLIAFIKLVKRCKKFIFKSQPHSDIEKIPSHLINNFLYTIMKFENNALNIVSFPYGSSIIAVFQKR